ncbi:Beta-1,3-galactosyltransferase 1, partial [Armadillidium nasatum]
WSRERVQNHFRRLLKPRLSGLIFYILLTIFVLFSFTSLGPKFPSSYGFSSKDKRQDNSKGVPSAIQGLCNDDDEIHLLILVTSSADHFNERQAIRSTWGHPDYLSTYSTRLIFLLANPNNLSTQRMIVEEYRTYGDLIQEDFVESYMNLTLKTVMGIKWASLHCSRASYVMKTDDDIFVNVPLLTTHLTNSFKPVNGDPSALLPPAHPLFAAGAGYVFSGGLLPHLFEASKHIRIIPVEDVYITGHLGKAVDAHPPLHDDRFSCGEIVRNNCHMKKVSEYSLIKKHKTLLNEFM